jgi:hypothetical protein
MACTRAHRLSHTLDVCILEQESHRQTKMIMCKGVLRAQNMGENRCNICLFTQATEAFIVCEAVCHIVVVGLVIMCDMTGCT